jgi:hypothetical protein
VDADTAVDTEDLQVAAGGIVAARRTVHLIALRKQMLRQQRAILPGCSENQRALRNAFHECNAEPPAMMLSARTYRVREA